MANLNELLIGLAFGKQTNIGTANTASIWRVPNMNRKPLPQRTVVEDDAAEIGKGHEFATQEFASHYDNGVYTIERPCSSEILAHAMAFGLGKTVKTGSAAPWTYTSTPLNTQTDGEEPPYLSFVQQMRPGASSVIDQLFVGNAVKGWKISIKNSPGRMSAVVSIDIVTSGVYTEPSAVTMPAPTPWHEMQMSSLSLVINGTDYVATKNFISLDMSWENNFRPGFFPGAPSQDGYATQGRFEVGDRSCGFSFVSRFAHGSTELATARALTSGTAVVGLQNGGGSTDAFTGTWQKMGFSTAELGEDNGMVVVQVTGKPLYDNTLGLFSAVTLCSVGGICQ